MWQPLVENVSVQITINSYQMDRAKKPVQKNHIDTHVTMVFVSIHTRSVMESKIVKMTKLKNGRTKISVPNIIEKILRCIQILIRVSCVRIQQKHNSQKATYQIIIVLVQEASAMVFKTALMVLTRKTVPISIAYLEGKLS